MRAYCIRIHYTVKLCRLCCRYNRAALTKVARWAGPIR